VTWNKTGLAAQQRDERFNTGSKRSLHTDSPTHLANLVLSGTCWLISPDNWASKSLLSDVTCKQWASRCWHAGNSSEQSRPADEKRWYLLAMNSAAKCKRALLHKKSIIAIEDESHGRWSSDRTRLKQTSDKHAALKLNNFYQVFNVLGFLRSPRLTMVYVHTLWVGRF